MTTQEMIGQLIDSMKDVLYEDETGIVSDTQLLSLINKAERLKEISIEAFSYKNID